MFDRPLVVEETYPTYSPSCRKVKTQKFCAHCGTLNRLTKHHLKAKIDGIYTRTGQITLLCRKCHDKVEKEDLANLESVLTMQVKNLMKAVRGRNPNFINRRVIQFQRALERLKHCNGVGLFNAEMGLA